MALVPIQDLPEQIDLSEAVRQCYSEALLQILAAVRSGQSVLVEADKLLVTFLLVALRDLNRSSATPVRLEIVDHRAGEAGATTATAEMLTRAVRSFAGQAAESGGAAATLVVPNFDLLVSADQTSTHLDRDTRDLMAVLHENPELVLVAFKDPNLSLPKTITAFFPRQIEIFGFDRGFMPHLITQAEARRIDTSGFDPYRLYKFVSGLNVVKLRRVLQGFTSPLHTDNSGAVMLDEVRRATLLDADAELPQVPLDRIGGYERVKKILREEVLGLLRFIQEKSATVGSAELKAYERLIPRHILFTGPPGTGKTFFCKALATELDATVIIVNGPELKNKWVGESERAIRSIFTRARKCAPALIVFDELDSFGRQRVSGEEPMGSDRAGAGTSHDSSMLNQLLTEMDGFRTEELVFVVGTTNMASALDAALLSRFKHQIDIPYPEKSDRRAILEIYDRLYDLDLSDDALAALVEETQQWIDQDRFTRFAGRDLETLASSLARHRVLECFHRGCGLGEVVITPALAAATVREKIRTRPVEITFDEIGGYRDVKQRLREEILDVLRAARDLPEEQRSKVDRLIPKGVIFEGPPGTGKTMFAQALANALEATISVVSGPELRGSLVGQTEERIRRLFDEARRNAPSVIVFDEIDSIASSREEYAAGGGERAAVNQLLTEMDGTGGRGLVFVVATTNFAKALDRALKRPGRFEYVMHIPYPDEEARREILAIYNRKYGLGLGEKEVSHLLFRTDNWVDPDAGIRFSGDHIEAICRGIARRRLMDRNWEPTADNLDRIVAQRTKKPLELAPDELAVVAAHEAGHAIVSLHTKGARPIKRISIASEYDGSLGYVLHEEQSGRYLESHDELLAEIRVLLAGRVAEQKLVGRIATGGSNDIERATRIATYLVAACGLDKQVGPRYVPHAGSSGSRSGDGVSPQLLRLVEEGVDAILREQEKLADRCLEEHWEEYNTLRERLMDQKVVEFRG